MQYFPVAEDASNAWPISREIKFPVPPSCTSSFVEPSVDMCIHVTCGLKSAMCANVRSFFLSLVTVGIVVLIVRLLLVYRTTWVG